MKSADLDDIQDNIIASKHATRTFKLSPLGIQIGVAGGAITYDGRDVSASPLIGDIGIHCVPVGDRITAIRVRVKDTAGNNVTARAYLGDDAGGRTALGGGATISNGSGTAQTLTLSGFPITVGTGGSLYVEIGPLSGSALGHLYSIEVDADKL